MTRRIVWFSCGAASAVAAKLTLASHPKGGIGYWNKIRRDFPATFDRMAALERDIGATVLRDDAGPLWLDELDPTRGDHANEPSFDCSLLCHLAEGELT